MKKSIKVTAPATVSNVGPGFDIMGFAINVISDEIIIRSNNKRKLIVKNITGDSGRISRNIKSNTAAFAISQMQEKLGIKEGYDIEIRKKIGLGGGLGSSAASAVAAVYGFNEILGKPFEKDELLDFALIGESVASKAIHADNVAPALYGGFILIRSYDPIDLIKLSYPKDLCCTVIYPQIEIKTSEARKIIRKTVSLHKAIEQTGNASALIAGLLKNDYDLIGRSLRDHFAEPYRAKLIPGYEEIKETALKEGAVGCSISGSGPSIFAFSKNLDSAENIGRAMKRCVKKYGMTSRLFLSKVRKNGPEITG